MKRLAPYVLIVAFIGIAYLPFFGAPLLRSTGDEKVYIAQALEMHQRGAWFAQTLANDTNYYKGPAYFLLARVGLELFGDRTLWAVVWMNAAGLLVAALALLRLGERLFRSPALALLLSAAFVASVGCFTHVFAAQMEAGLVCTYVLTMWAAARATPDRPWRSAGVWMLIGVAGWLKSPLHAALLGIGLLGFWVLTGEMKARWRQRREWLALLAGLLVGVAGYLIPWLIDGDRFLETYVLRETMNKGRSGPAGWQAVLPALSLYLWPFMPLAWLGLLAVGRRWRRLDRASRLGLALALPTTLFFSLHPFRNEIYVLPAVPAYLLVAVSGLRGALRRWPAAVRLAVGAAAASTLLLPLAVGAATWRFAPTTAWWPTYLAPLTVAATLATIALMLPALGEPRSHWRLALATLAFAPWLAATAQVLEVVGAKDLAGLQAAAERPGTKLGYYNLQRHTWSEWGLLQLLIGFEVKGLHDDGSLRRWLEERGTVIVAADYVDDIQRLAGAGVALETVPWRRWEIRGRGEKISGLRAAWQARDLTVIQRDMFLVRQRVYGSLTTSISDGGRP